MTVVAAITPATIRDGDPAALAALCERRGGAILAYCEEVAGPDQAIAAAADALGSFRAAVAGPEDLAGTQAEALLRRMVRRSAISRGVDAQPEVLPPNDCLKQAVELVDYFEDALPASERDTVSAHVGRCRSCAAALQRLREGERAYKRAGIAMPLPSVSAVLLEALLTAAPLRVHGEDESSVRAEALRLLSGDGGAVEPATPAPAPPPDEPAPAPPPNEPASALPADEPAPALPPHEPASALPADEPAPALPRDEPPAETAMTPQEVTPPAAEPPAFDAPPVRRPVRARPSDPLRLKEVAAPAPTEGAASGEASPARRKTVPTRAASKPGRMSKLMQTGKPWRARAPLHQGRFDALLRGAGRLLAVVVLAGAAGLLLGIGLAKLTGEDTTSAPPLTGAQTSSPASPASDGASTDSPASTTTKATAATPATETTETISTGGRLRVDVLSTIVRPVASPSGNTSQRARVSVHVRVTNDTGRVVASPQPTLLVGDARLDVANASSQAASPLLRQLAVEAVADGTLRFEAEGALTDQLTMAPIKLRIVGKTLTLAPVVGDAVAPG